MQKIVCFWKGLTVFTSMVDIGNSSRVCLYKAAFGNTKSMGCDHLMSCIKMLMVSP